jgi:prepilin-type N-terminal cleavage/methylation domain-containing protein
MKIFLPSAKFSRMRILRDPSGFTLVEVLVAVTILLIGFLGVQSLGVGIVRGNLFSDRLTAATTLTQDKLELIRRLNYRCVGSIDPAQGCAPPNGINVGTTVENPVLNNPFYIRQTLIEAGIGTPAEAMKKVTVTVYWDSDSSVKVTSYVAE